MMPKVFLTMLFLHFFAAAALSASADPPDAAKASYEKGVAAIEQAKGIKDYQSAVKEFEAAIRIGPEWPDPSYALARVAAEIGKPVKAAKAYTRYLQLAPDAADKAKVEGEILRLQQMSALRKRIGVAGISFMVMKDGIYVTHVLPGSGIERSGLKAGDKITAVNGKVLTGATIYDFYRTVEEGLSAPTSATKRLAARTKTSIDPGQWVAFSLLREGQQVSVTCPRNNFAGGKRYEIEDDEFEEEVLKSPAPVLVTFWTPSCGPCQRSTASLEALAQQYAGPLKFVNLNIDENPVQAGKLDVKAIPTVMLFKSGKQIEKLTGMQTKEQMEELIKKGL